jgi:hypothetical protein
MSKYTFDNVKELMAKSHEARESFLQNLLTIATGMLTILAAFHTSKSGSSFAQIIFSTTVILLSVGIISGAINLYFKVRASKFLFAKVKEDYVKGLRDANHQSEAIVYEPPQLFYLCETVCYVSLLLSVIALTIYVLVK